MSADVPRANSLKSRCILRKHHPAHRAQQTVAQATAPQPITHPENMSLLMAPTLLAGAGP